MSDSELENLGVNFRHGDDTYNVSIDIEVTGMGHMVAAKSGPGGTIVGQKAWGSAFTPQAATQFMDELGLTGAELIQ